MSFGVFAVKSLAPKESYQLLLLQPSPALLAGTTIEPIIISTKSMAMHLTIVFRLIYAQVLVFDKQLQCF